MDDLSLPPQAASILVALGAGLLSGVERERHVGQDKAPAAAGVRTFALNSSLGVFASLSGSNVVLAAGGLTSMRASAQRIAGFE